MELNIIHDPDEQRFYADLEGEEAELSYNYLEDDLLDFDYTFVPKKYRNKGVSDALVQAGLEFVKSRNFMFVPSCNAVEVYLKRHPEYNHLAKEEQ